MFGFLKNIFGETQRVDLAALIQEGAYLVDVRSPQEFASGTVKGAVNIPLDKLQSQLKKCEGKNHIIVFCRSGARSGQAKSILERNGLTNVTNGGPWQNVNQFINR